MEARIHTSTLEESAIIERVARIVFSVRGAKSDYTRLAAELEQAVPFDIFGVVLLRHDRQAVRVTVCLRENGLWIAKYHQHPLGSTSLEHTFEKSKLLVQDYPDGLDGPPATSGYALSGYHQLRSTLIAPLFVEDRLLGTLELGSIVPHIYADVNRQRIIKAVAGVLATAIESVQLGGNAAIQDKQRRALKSVTSALNAKKDLSSVLNQIVEGITDALNVGSCILLLDRRKGRLSLEAQSGLEQTALDKIFAQNLYIGGKCIIWHTLRYQKPFMSQDINIDENFAESSIFFTEQNMRSVFSYPLVTGTKVYGTLLLCSTEPGGFTPLKADILALFANQATVAIHNGMLLESVHQRSRFQQSIEQLEQSRKRRTTGPLTHQSTQDDLQLLEHVREETQRTFGVSFTSLLRFMSDHLLTESERDLQAVFATEQDEQPLEFVNFFRSTTADNPVNEETEASRERKDPFEGTLSLLEQTAESALTRAGMLGELSRLLLQLKQSTNWVKDAWFVVDLDGFCTYMNPAAESFCDIRLVSLPTTYGSQLLVPPEAQGPRTLLKIEEVFVKLRSRMRNVAEVDGYLQEFAQNNIYRQELRCILAVEPIVIQTTLESKKASSIRMESAPSDYHYHFTRYPLFNRQGQLEAVALQVHDVTEQVRDEKNRSALLSSVSHDLRTPLTTIKAAVTGLLQSGVAWSEQDRQAMLEDIDSEADHLSILINALVELSRIEMGALILEKEWCDAIEIAYGALSKLTRVLAGRPVRTQFQSHLPLIYVDHAQLERVFYNLIENAVRHSPEQTEIVIALDTVGEGPEMIRAQIIDHGVDIPEDEREHIFKSFYSLQSYGNGMGLAICKGIIEAHQGTIWVDTAPEAGSRFVFTLPPHPHTIVHADVGTISNIDREIPSNHEKQKDRGD